MRRYAQPDRLPKRQRQTAGWLVAPSGAGVRVLSGGRSAEDEAGIKPDYRNRPLLVHAEGRAAKAMRSPDAPSRAELVINNEMCGSCRDWLADMIPQGKTLRVFERRTPAGEPTWVGDFAGTGRGLIDD